MFLRSWCHRLPSQYSACHTARHTFRSQRPSARRLTRIPLPPTLAMRALGPSFLPQSTRPSMPRPHRALPSFPWRRVCVAGWTPLPRHRFNITDVLFAFQPLSYYPLFPASITLTVIWTSTTSFQLYLLQKLNFVLKKKKLLPHRHGNFTERNGVFFFLSIKQP